MEDEIVIAISRKELGFLLEGSTILGLAGKKLFDRPIGEEDMEALRALVRKLQGLYWEEEGQ